MINRAKMPRQLRNKGGITSIVPREQYGLGSKIKDRVRKLIPNELADVAVKAAPFVAPFSPKTAALMRGIGRFDQRGSISDAFKQGAATFAFGAGTRKLGGAENVFGDFGFSSPLSPERTQALGSLFQSQQAAETAKTADDARKGFEGVKRISDATIGKVPILKELPSMVQQQLFAGGITAGASLLASYFQGEFEEQQPGETIEEYLARRKENVGIKMRTYFDNYFSFDKEYSQLDDAGRDAFVARYNLSDGGRIGYQTGGITMANTLAENIRRNIANQAAFRQAINPSREKVLQKLQANQPKSSPLETFGKHAMVSQAMKGKTGMGVIPEYALQTGADFQKKFSNVNPKVSATLAAGYQTLQEGARALNPLNPDKFLRFPTALKTAQEQATKNIEGILAADTGTLTAKQQADRNKYLASQGQIEEPVMVADSSLITPEPSNKTFAPDSEGFAAYAGIVPGFKAKKRSDGRFNYKAPDGQIYGPDTYTMIAAGNYPDIFDPRANVASGGMPTGIMRKNKAGVIERDYRDEGGFVPVGIKEKADDVPAMLSKNEFVFTADAVRGAGNGSIEKGAQKMYDTMKRLEKRVV